VSTAEVTHRRMRNGRIIIRYCGMAMACSDGGMLSRILCDGLGYLGCSPE